MGICLQYEMANVDIDPNSVEMYFGMRYAPGGYAWIIPMGLDMANVGIGIRASYMRGLRLPNLLDKFIEGHPVARDRLNGGRILAIIRGSVPASGTPGSIQKGSVLLAGDAAGHVMATSGGGIPLAMVAGKIAGEVASGSITGQLKLDDYARIINAEFGKELERSVQIRRMVDVVMRSDRLMDAILGALEPNQIKSIIRGKMPSAFSAIYNNLVDRSHL
jgi:digeranylgeranylglycerophospholipid reductase